jgi:acetolactate synthase I/II/III large subunit|tara:strand:- start:1613 stop:2824 length:1212 start_codon:yes stop_codon:yes gene_type:complete
MKLEIIKKLIENSKRPVVLAGSGINISGTQKELLKFVKKNSLPIVTAWAHDIYPNNDQLYYGRQGSIGNRVGNFIVQYADLVLVLGSRLNIRQTSYNWKEFAKNAIIISVDVDSLELKKNLIKINYKIQMDLKNFFIKINKLIIKNKNKNNVLKWSKWINWCNFIRSKFTPKLEDYKKYHGKINIYHFIITLFKLLKKNEIIVAADGTATVVPNQVGYLNKNIRYIANSGSASMGFELPASIGAAIADRKKKIICLAGDGSIMMNLQELQTIKSLNLNIIIFLINNDGYLSIKQTQKNFFGKEHGSSPKSGLTFPNFLKIAKSFNIQSYDLKHKNWEKQLKKIIALKKGPLFVNINVDTKQEFEPKLKSKTVNNKIVTPSLENMYPFLSDKTNKMILKKLNEE